MSQEEIYPAHAGTVHCPEGTHRQLLDTFSKFRSNGCRDNQTRVFAVVFRFVIVKLVGGYNFPRHRRLKIVIAQYAAFNFPDPNRALLHNRFAVILQSNFHSLRKL